MNVFHVVTVLNSTTKREPFNETPAELPGTIVVSEYDKGPANVSYNNASRTATTTTKDGGWMEYTVDVKEDGVYSFDAEIASKHEWCASILLSTLLTV